MSAHVFLPGQLVFLTNKNPVFRSKSELIKTGPYPILQTYTNGTVLLQLPNGMRETVGIRRITPARV